MEDSPRTCCDALRQEDSRRPRRTRQHRRHSGAMTASLVLAVLATALPVAMAQDCIPLQGSTVCPAFSSASVSTGSGLSAQ
jgi:hypothetical protein